MNPMASAPAQTAPRDKDAAATMVVPFVRAAQEHVEPFLDVSLLLTAANQQINPVDIPAYGFMRGIIIEVTGTGGTGTAAVYKADGPFTALTDVRVADVNGAPIYGPLDGYDVFQTNKVGGYRRPGANPKLVGDFAAPTSGNFTYLTYVPIETNGRDALGSLANLNAASSYKLSLTLAQLANIFTTNPTGIPTVRVRAWLDAWTQPTPTDLKGQPQAVEPPAHGTTAYWSRSVYPVVAGQNTIRLTRVGNLVRNLVFIYRDVSLVRNKTNFPPSFQIYWDTRLLKDYSPIVWRAQMAQRYGLAGADESSNGLDTGVYVEDYMHEFDGLAGFEMRDGWLPTVGSTRLEVQGVFGAAGSLTVLTNDVSPAGEGVYI